ncbi:MAG: tandem-95 repeat protein [Rhodoferax sp.]|nr:tandem-95 repeat protein [Rhodoferax sp.]
MFSPTPPNANFNGVDSFTYTITDADGATSRATVTLNVGAVDVPWPWPTPRGRHRGPPLPPAWPQRHALGRWRQCLEQATRPTAPSRDRGRCFHLHPQRQLQWRGQLHLHHHRRRWRHLQRHRHPNVGAVNDVPVAVADTPVGVTEDTPFTASLASNDTPSGDGGNVWSKTTDPANGTVTVTAAGVFPYTPNANFNGVDSFTYTITDADGSTSSATVTLNVGAVNDVPVAVADTPWASPRTRRLPPAWPPTTRPRAMAAMSGARPPIRPTAPSP